MKVPFYLIVNSKGTVRTTKTQPDLRFDEVSMRIDLNLPDQLFKKPILSAQILIPDAAATPPAISADVMNNVQEAIRTAAGMEVKISVITESDANG